MMNQYVLGYSMKKKKIPEYRTVTFATPQNREAGEQKKEIESKNERRTVTV